MFIKLVKQGTHAIVPNLAGYYEDWQESKDGLDESYIIICLNIQNKPINLASSSFCILCRLGKIVRPRAESNGHSVQPKGVFIWRLASPSSQDSSLCRADFTPSLHEAFVAG